MKGLILPVEPKGHLHNFYSYTCRIDMAAIGWTGDPTRMRDAILMALKAEGVPVSVWQRFILPAMTVFRAKNAYGRGCPWSCNGAGDGVVYEPADFPVAQKHADTHVSMTTALRAPNGPDVAEKIGEAYAKVFANIQAIDPDRILADAES
ncbi:MAG: hypothetical protein GX592_13420 [Clostridiales bacterium]|nr:hypothetical protein [Clostridiales bacterium]